MMKKRSFYIALLFAAILLQGLLVWLFTPKSEGTRFVFSTVGVNLVLEFLDDDLLHIEYSNDETRPEVDQPIFTSLMVSKTDYSGPDEIQMTGRGQIETSQIKVQVNLADLCVTVIDKQKNPELILSIYCPYHFKEEFKGITFTQETFTNVYGLGEKFISAGETDGDWVGLSRFPGKFGNVQEPWNKGSVGNDQFPVAYMVGGGKDCYGLFLDNQYKQLWDFTNEPWKAVMFGDQVRFYVFTGPDLPDLRADFMELVGKPPVPPKKALGLWLSEYGYDSWDELEDKLATLRENHFPVDGFVLDLQWYGGILEGSDDTRQGSLSWDLANFSNPVYKVSKLKDEEGLGLVLIEQPYVGKNLSEHAEMESKGYLVKGCATCDPVYLTKNPWWGKGGMIDWTNPEASAYWHDWKREPLIDAGVLGHWTDLGEPELYDEDGWYAGIQEGEAVKHSHQAAHNLYNLLWSKSIFEGYARNQHLQRPFILSRSGTVGSQRYGVAMWSGDISSLLSSLATHLNVQMHMSMSGVDYYGSDIGGFWRQGGDVDEIYTQWFANGAAFDVPVRAHTFNLCNCEETAPDRIGDLQSNLKNIRQRYALSPYYYSLAHRAYLYGEPVVPPLVYTFQDDVNVREIGAQKMIGKNLMAVGAAEDRALTTEVYLPRGVWVDYHTSNWFESDGEWLEDVNLYPDGYFTLPLYAKAGAIIPEMFVDEQTMNIEGLRMDGSRRDELILRVYASEEPNEFTLYEDDGITMAYQNGEVRRTVIEQQITPEGGAVIIHAAEGTYDGAQENRDNIIRLYVDQRQAKQVWLNGEPLPRYDALGLLEGVEQGWVNLEGGQIYVKSGVLPVGLEKKIEFLLEPEELPLALAVSEMEMPENYWPTDAWLSSAPEMLGMDSEQLLRAVSYLDEQAIDIHRALIVRDGYAAVDVRYTSLMADQDFSRRSTTTSVLSALVGIAIEKGFIESVHQPLLDFFPDHVIENESEYKHEITLEHLLTMTSGFICNDQAGESSTAFQMMQSEDWVQHMLDLPVSDKPGTTFNPCAGVSHLLSAVIQKSTGGSTFEFAKANLFDPLGIKSAVWKVDPQGINVGPFGLYMDLEDTAKFGYLYLKMGSWEGEAIISHSWVEQSIAAYLPGGSYGYGWWLDEKGYYTWGRNRHGLFIVPDEGLLVAVSGGIQEKDGMELEIFMKSLVLPSIRSSSPLPENMGAYKSLHEHITMLGEIEEPQPIPELPPLAHQISGNTYLLDVGEAGIEQTFTLEFPGGDVAYLVQMVNGERIEIQIGMDGVFRVLQIPDNEYIDLVMDDTPAFKGTWKDGSQFELDLIYVNSGRKEKAIFSFDGDVMILELWAGTTPSGVIEARLIP